MVSWYNCWWCWIQIVNKNFATTSVDLYIRGGPCEHMPHTAQSLDNQATAIKPVGHTATSITASGVTVWANKLQQFVNWTNKAYVLWNTLCKISMIIPWNMINNLCTCTVRCWWFTDQIIITTANRDSRKICAYILIYHWNVYPSCTSLPPASSGAFSSSVLDCSLVSNENY